MGFGQGSPGLGHCHHSDGGARGGKTEGSIGTLLSLSSKCRCVPVQEPVQPAWPIGSPSSSHWPGTTCDVLRWAYSVESPLPESTVTTLP